MKKTLKFIPLLLIAVLGITLSSCSDDDDPITPAELPASAKVFISTYYPDATILSANQDDDGYEVTLSDGTNIDFNYAGLWQDVDAPFGQSVPTGFYPMAIDEYLSLNLPGAAINEISIEPSGNFEVELIDGTDILFGPEGSFIGYIPD